MLCSFNFARGGQPFVGICARRMSSCANKTSLLTGVRDSNALTQNHDYMKPPSFPTHHRCRTWSPHNFSRKHLHHNNEPVRTSLPSYPHTTPPICPPSTNHATLRAHSATPSTPPPSLPTSPANPLQHRRRTPPPRRPQGQQERQEGQGQDQGRYHRWYRHRYCCGHHRHRHHPVDSKEAQAEEAGCWAGRAPDWIGRRT